MLLELAEPHLLELGEVEALLRGKEAKRRGSVVASRRAGIRSSLGLCLRLRLRLSLSLLELLETGKLAELQAAKRAGSHAAGGSLLSLRLLHCRKVGLAVDRRQARAVHHKVVELHGVHVCSGCGRAGVRVLHAYAGNIAGTACGGLSGSLLLRRLLLLARALHKRNERLARNDVRVELIGDIHACVAEQLDDTGTLLRRERDRNGRLTWSLSRLTRLLRLLLGLLRRLRRLLGLLLRNLGLGLLGCGLLVLVLEAALLGLGLQLPELQLLDRLRVRLGRKLLQCRGHRLRVGRQARLLGLLRRLEALAVWCAEILRGGAGVRLRCALLLGLILLWVVLILLLLVHQLRLELSLL